LLINRTKQTVGTHKSESWKKQGSECRKTVTSKGEKKRKNCIAGRARKPKACGENDGDWGKSSGEGRAYERVSGEKFPLDAAFATRSGT